MRSNFKISEDIQKWKNARGIAIEMGLEENTQALLLAKNYFHVIVLQKDPENIQLLQKSLEEEECSNVRICNKSLVPAKHVSMASGQVLTLKELLFEYIYTNEDLEPLDIALIRLDAAQVAEQLIEDVLHFAYNNLCAVEMLLPADFWKSDLFFQLEYLFPFFSLEHISEHSVHLYPKLGGGTMVKKNMPVLIIGYNQFTYIKNMVRQLEKYTKDIIIVDNASDFPPLLEYYEKEYPYTLLRQKVNCGHMVYKQDSIQHLLGDLYLLTDPDLLFNTGLPDRFIEDLIELSNHFQAGRVGFALHIDSDDIRMDITHKGHDIKTWESQMWKERLFFPLRPSLELYQAEIDTTFCLINRKYRNKSIRVAGDYTCIHMPWHMRFQEALETGELDYYLRNNISSTWIERR